MKGWQSLSHQLKAKNNVSLFDDMVQCSVCSRKGQLHGVMASVTHFQLLLD